MENIITLDQLVQYKHPYYCSDSSYFGLDFDTKYDTWEDFYSEMGDSDNDYNLVFRWDIRKLDDNDIKNAIVDDGYDPEVDSPYSMEVFVVHQRKGRFVPFYIENVYEKDLTQILIYLKDKHSHLKKLWTPFQ